MPVPGRQIEGVTGETLVKDLARAAIEQRLAAVLTAFPLAAQESIDGHEPVHQLRVSTRRAVAALKLFQNCCPRRRTRRLLKQLKRIRRAAGAARDLDVFTTRLAKTADDAHQVLRNELVAKRQAAQGEIVQLYHRLTDDHCLSEQIQGVIERLHPRGKKALRRSDQTVSRWASRRFHKAAQRFLTAVPESLAEPEELHTLRIEGKRLRYTLELLSVGLPTATHESLFPLLKEMQDHLGAINDQRVAIERLKTHSSAGHAAINQVVEREQVAMQQAIEQVRVWFQDSFLPRLHAAIRDRNVASATAAPEAASA